MIDNPGASLDGCSQQPSVGGQWVGRGTMLDTPRASLDGCSQHSSVGGQRSGGRRDYSRHP